ncbi:hypothetical protein DM02DRAFT_560621, partial [Periconia macrospinosa]
MPKTPVAILTTRLLRPQIPTLSLPFPRYHHHLSTPSPKRTFTKMTDSIPLHILPIPTEHNDLVRSVNTFVHGYMSSPGHDSSHDYQHILRVVSNANRILALEKAAHPEKEYDVLALFLAAFLHDVGDHKYASSETPESQISTILLANGCSSTLATRVQTVVKHVSYSHEVKNPESVRSVLDQYPELGIVQDADRLDAIGAVGVARCFTFSGAKRPGEPMMRAIEHFEEKLMKLGGMMKTGGGRELAERRGKVVEEFRERFLE